MEKDMEEDNFLDVIGIWSEIKLEIIKKYALAYSIILTNKKKFDHVYIDAFAGPGLHISKTTKELVSGSPLNALNIKPPFKIYYFIDIDKMKVNKLEEISKERQDVKIYQGDCNEILINDIFPYVLYKNYKRGLCLLDPYGLHLDWEIIKMAGEMKSIEIFLNFPIADINRNVLLHDKDKVDSTQIERLNKFWGDESWRDIAYQENPQVNIFNKIEYKKCTNDNLVEAFRNRLIKEAGFKHVPCPMPMRNSKNAIVYYLFFASPNPVANKIVNDIFEKYRKREI